MSDENRIVDTQRISGENGYVYAFKNRARRHHCLGYGTFKIDLRNLEQARKAYSRQVRPITYKPILVKATAIAIEQTPEANSILFRSGLGMRVVRFDSVDVNLPITRELDGRTITYVATIRRAAEKSLAEIQTELTHFQKASPEDCFPLRRFQKFAGVPLWVARLIHWWMTRSPRFYVGNVGTCGLTFSEYRGTGQFFPVAPTSVVFGIGGTSEEPVVREGQLEVGRVMNCALMIDNFVISGLAGVQLAEDFRELLESASFVWNEMSGSSDRSDEP